MEGNGDKHTQQLELALAYADNIIATLREPFVVLDESLRVKTANAAFYRTSVSRKRKRKAASSTTWATASGTSPACGRCWRKSCPTAIPFHDFEVEHDFPAIGTKDHAAQRPPLPAGGRATRT